MILRDSPELVWRVSGLGAFAITAVASLLPEAAPPAAGDKMIHVLVYALIAALLARGAWTRKGSFMWAAAAVGGGVLIELAQGFVGRDPSVSDAFANLVGASLGALLGARHAAARPSKKRKGKSRSDSASSSSSSSFTQSEGDAAPN